MREIIMELMEIQISISKIFTVENICPDEIKRNVPEIYFDTIWLILNRFHVASSVTKLFLKY